MFFPSFVSSSSISTISIPSSVIPAKVGIHPCFRWFIVGLFIFAMLSVPVVSQAAEMYFGTPTQTVAPGVPIEVGVFVDTVDQATNAVEGEVVFPGNRFTFEGMYDRGSIVSFWIETPSVPNACQDECVVRFSGIIPGGFRGARGYLFSLILNPVQGPSGRIVLREAQALAHDGSGTKLSLNLAPMDLTIRSGATSTPFIFPSDQEAPEPFIVTVTQDVNLYEGRPTLIFATQDKGAGLDYYDVREAWFGSWGGSFRRGDSPYVLEHSGRLGMIEVRAHDRFGHVRSSYVPTRHSWAAGSLASVFVLVVLGVLALFVRWLLRRRSKS